MRKILTRSGLLLAGLLGAAACPGQEVIIGEPTLLQGSDAADTPAAFKRKPRMRLPEELMGTQSPHYAVVLLFVDEKGKPRSYSRAGTSAELGARAMLLLKELPFTPAKRDGAPVAAWTMISVVVNPVAAKNAQTVDARLLEAVAPLVDEAVFKNLSAKERTIWARLEIDAEGRVTAFRAKGAADIGEAVKRWRFAPALADGKPVASKERVPVKLMARPEGTPTLVRQPFIKYPAAMSQSGLTGRVEVAFTVNRNGDVENPRIVRANNPGFEKAALEAVLSAKYKPATRDGKPVSQEVRQTVDFQMPGTPSASSGLEVEVSKKDMEEMPENLRFDKAPEARGSVRPVYPRRLLEEGTGGKAVVSLFLDKKGNVSFARLVEASHPEFGASLLAAAGHFEFTPARRERKPVETVLRYEHVFNPKDCPREDAALLSLERKKPGKIIPANKLDAPLKPLSRREAKFPVSLGPEVKSGRAVVEFLIDEDGTARLPRIIEATDEAFGHAAAQAVSYWKFEAPKAGGKTVVTRVRVPVAFARKDG
ncbi:MAG: TonB family protein [Opitutaceae bacterium]|jgi:TonB family protein|nr:TonB family protein [Opitutaceae bacterium]